MRGRLLASYESYGEKRVADMTGWWGRADVLSDLGPALAGLHQGERPTTVMGPESMGFLLGPLVAIATGTGFVQMRKDMPEDQIADQVLVRNTPPDYNNRTLRWSVRRRNLRTGQRVLFVDDWVETAATAQTARRLVEAGNAVWVGAVAIVDATEGQERRDLGLRSLLRGRELW
ncbi:phosphoribosyltransferase family protein [Actinomadura hibisca]|uniref:phosphoribosyltransferase family protein n=1 Tax=Actinomadura hibisca TaxID=68565 RepID=UPI00082D17B1|nr:phosphoribosyltransferase family protein [Actinomadura hibisca]